MDTPIRVKGSPGWTGEAPSASLMFKSGENGKEKAKALSQSHLKVRKLLIINRAKLDDATATAGNDILIGNKNEQTIEVAPGGGYEIEDVFLDNVFVSVIGTITGFVLVGWAAHGDPFIGEPGG